MKFILILLIALFSHFAYSMEWSFRSFSNLEDQTSADWKPVLGDRPLVSREYQGYIEYKTYFKSKSDLENTAIYLGKIGDVDKVYLNDTLIGQTGSFPPNFSYSMDVERLYFAPNSIIKENTENELRVLVYVQFLVNKGLNIKNVEIGENKELQQRKYSSELFDNLSKVVIPILCIILAAISFPIFAPKPLWMNQVLITLIGISSFILGFCRSRIGYHFFEMIPVYKLTLISSVFTIGLVSIYATGIKTKITKRLSYTYAFIVLSLAVMIYFQKDLLSAASIGKIWFHIAPVLVLTSIICAFKNEATDYPLKFGLIALFITNLNDNLNDLRVIQSTPLLQIGLGLFVASLILNQIIRLKKSWESFFKKEIDLESEAKLGRQSLQLAHDIRSPLEALKSTTNILSEVPETERNIILRSISRIEGIAHNLLRSNSITAQNTESSTHLLTHLDWVIEEKRLQYQNHEKLFIITNYSNNCYNTFTNLCSEKMKRIFSNLITNAAEATNFDGVVRIDVREMNEGVEVKVKDNGPGFDSKYMENYFTKGFSTKSNGHGLGLSNAKKEIEEVGGTIRLSNDNGASVSIFLKKTPSPANFVSSINLSGIDTVIILDDDLSIHDMWAKRFKQIPVSVEYFTSPEALMQKYKEVPSNTLLFSDYDLQSEINGIGCIKTLKAETNSILVTGKAFEDSIIKETLSSSIRLLPKTMIKSVPVINNDRKVVLIDDDELIQIGWRRSGKKMGYDVQTFTTIEDFLKSSPQFKKETPIFIDSNLGNGIKGEIESEKIHELGFQRLYLATGYQKSEINVPNWILEVYSKNAESNLEICQKI